nr:glucose-methanol-choline oxidoreductase, FAD/NAD(P)-binding domain protein [Tanacetum cinerariifolium]
MACIEEIEKDAKLIKIEDQLLVLIKRQVETKLMLEEKFRDLCEELSNFVNEIEDVVKEFERLSCKDMVKETVRLLRPKELFQSCKQYGHVVDTFIPNKRSKAGRRFHLTPLNEKKSMPKKAGGVKKDIGVNEVGNSYVHVVKGQMQPGNKESEATHALPLWNLILKWVEVEGIPYKLWSDNTFKRIATNWGELLDIDDQDEMCFYSKRLCIYTKSEKDIFEEFKIIFRGRAFWIRAKEAPGWVPNIMEENDEEEQNDDGGFNVHELGSCGGDSDVEGTWKQYLRRVGRKKTTWMRN